MLTPEYLASCTDYLLGMYDALNQALAEDIARRIVKTGKMTDSAKWQVKQLRENGELMQDIVKDVARISGKSEAEVKRIFQDSARKGVRYDAQPLLKAGYDIDLKLSPAMNQVLEAAIAKTNGDIKNLTMTTGSTAGGAYLEATNKAYMKVTSGGFSYYEAIRQAIKESAQDGSYVLYGKGHHSQLDVAIRRSVLTGVNQTAGKLTELYAEDMDVEYYETTAHVGARPSHAEWQGRVFKIHGSSPDYPNFEESTGYGTGAGLCGWNCRHSFYPFWPGISKPRYSKETLADYDKAKYEYNGNMLTDYECSQIQRAMEREIRSIKRVLASYDAALKETTNSELESCIRDDFAAESVKLKSKEKELKKFCNDTNRDYESNRTQVVAYKDNRGKIVNFGRSTAQKAVQSNKHIEKIAESAYNKGTTDEKVELYFKDKKLREYLKSDKVQKNVFVGRQEKHILGSNNYKHPNSYLTISMDEAQELINKYAGTGKIKRDSKGKWTHMEFVVADHDIGVDIDPLTGVETKTRRFSIRYADKGTHIVPAREVDNA